MKFIALSMWPIEKTAEIAAVGDKVNAKLPKERRGGSAYILLCNPSFDVPPNAMVSVGIFDGDSAEEIAEANYPSMLAGASIQIIPVLEVPAGSYVKADKKYKG